MNVLELYSGVGGMHMALNESGVEGKIVCAVEISTVANTVYSHNFPETFLLNKNVEGLTAEFINNLKVNAIFMSPPCQPFTRNGMMRDQLDSRTKSFFHILHLLPSLKVKYILIENVKGFETSAMRDKLMDALRICNFISQEFILSPTQIGVSNTRHRYYCLAKKISLKFNFRVGGLKVEFPDKSIQADLFPISDIIETNESVKDYLLSDMFLLRHVRVLDICNPSSRRSCCFTKAYRKYAQGTGSVFTPKSQEEIEKAFKEFDDLPNRSSPPKRTLAEALDREVSSIRKLELRYFTPKEVARLMSFPESFSFPNEITREQKYKLLGNSINVKVVSKLIQILVEN